MRGRSPSLPTPAPVLTGANPLSPFPPPPLTPNQVIAVGPGKADDDGKATPPSLAVGATVLYSKYSGTELKNPRDDEEYVVISAADVLATVA